jgi:hypothetical protein
MPAVDSMGGYHTSHGQRTVWEAFTPAEDSMGGFYAHCYQRWRLLGPSLLVWEASTPTMDSVGGFHTIRGQLGGF